MSIDKYFFTIITLIVLGVFGFIIFTSFEKTIDLNNLSASFIKGDNPNLKGAKDAEVTIVEFSDFQCPACRAFSSELESILVKYDKKVNLVYRHFPLTFHTNALIAAKASEAAAKQGKFWEYHHELFANFDKYSKEDLERYAKNIALDVELFKKDLDSKEVLEKVQADLSTGERLRLSGTPSFYIVKGEKVEGIQIKEYKDVEKKVIEFLGITAESENDITKYIPLITNLVNVYKKDLNPSDIKITSDINKEWSDGSMGCAEKGKVYTQALTKGKEVILEANSEKFIYHADENMANFVLCDKKYNPNLL